MAENLLTRPKLYGEIRQSQAYRNMSLGETARILLIGHADGLPLNDPYQVNDIQEAINVLQADGDSPLLRGLLEVYNAGARDIWLVAAAPMSEFRFRVEEGIQSVIFPGEDVFPGEEQVLITFYEMYYDRLQVTYEVLKDLDIAEIVVPLEAPFYWAGEDIDFLTQLIDFCSTVFDRTGTVTLGLIGTRIPESFVNADVVEAMTNDARLETLSSAGKFVSIVFGEGLVNFPQLNFSYRACLATQTAARMATTPLDRGISYLSMPNVVNINGANLTSAQIDKLVQAKINPIVRTTKAKRGAPFETVLLTDNTLGITGTDFWSMTQMRILASCANTIRVMGYNWIGSTDFIGYKKAVYEYLVDLVRLNVIKNFDLTIERLNDKDGKIAVSVSLTPIFGIRVIQFTVQTGLGV